jgi:hypothetical protein
MAQFDLHLLQNVAESGVEFSEKLVNLSKGGLLTVDASGVPTVRAVGTNDYVLAADSSEATGLKWIALSANHDQNTDTGTTQNSFNIDSGGTGVKLKNDSGALNLRNLADDAYADLVVKNLTVMGTTTTINSTTITVDDKNIELGSVDTPSDTTADGGGITLKGTTDKTILWDNGNDNWTLNQNVNIPTGFSFKINNTVVLSATQVLGVTLGTMAAAATADYVPKSLFDANTFLFAASDNTPAALAGIDVPTKFWAAVPADKIGTGYSGTAVAGQMAKDGNYLYICETGGTAGNQLWTKIPKITNWAA